jgi:hypothetical protein
MKNDGIKNELKRTVRRAVPEVAKSFMGREATTIRAGLPNDGLCSLD